MALPARFADFRRFGPPIAAAFAALVVLALACCSGGGAASRPAATQAAASQPAELRIVSLSPAITRTLIDFSLHRSIVGRTPHCESIDKSIPVVGDLLNLDYERLLAVKPTHVLVQPPASGLDSKLQQLAADHGWRLGAWKLNNRDDIETLVRDLPGVLYADGTPERAKAAARAAEIQSDIANALSPGPDRLFTGRTLVVSGVNPVMAFGRRTYMNDVMAAFGAANAVDAEGWVQLSLEDVARIDPQAIIVVRHGDPDEPIESIAGPLWDIDVDATRNRRVGVLNHPDAFMPCSGIVGVAREMRGILRTFQEGSH